MVHVEYFTFVQAEALHDVVKRVGVNGFLHGLPHWAISIALERKGEIVAAVIYDAAKDEMFVAEKGAGAWMNDRRLRVSGRRDFIEMIFATGVPFAGSKDLPQTLKELAVLMPRCAGVRRWGAAALDLAYVAAGRYDVAPSQGCRSCPHRLACRVDEDAQ